MTVELLIQAIVHQTTVLIAQLATLGGGRAPLAQVANQVFLDLVRELERQGVSRKVSADMFGLGLRTYRRKIQRLSESSTERGRSLWEVVLEYIKTNGPVTREAVLLRFSLDDEAQVKSVLRDLCESQLVILSKEGNSPQYRAASDNELLASRSTQNADGLDDLLVALMFREGPLTQKEIAHHAQSEEGLLEAPLTRLAETGRIQLGQREGQTTYEARALVVPVGASVGWEAAIFDHYKALVTTILHRLNQDEEQNPEASGGSTYTIDVWPGHPLEEEVTSTLARIRHELSDLRSRVLTHNRNHEQPNQYRRAVIYAGQRVIEEESE